MLYLNASSKLSFLIEESGIQWANCIFKSKNKELQLLWLQPYKFTDCACTFYAPRWGHFESSPVLLLIRRRLCRESYLSVVYCIQLVLNILQYSDFVTALWYLCFNEFQFLKECLYMKICLSWRIIKRNVNWPHLFLIISYC